ncbi:tRNA ligase [Mycena kentingensis (nom. inval.)]|nr:tRNA ligase [Mycena kentingensis (nom. inval.)]
MAHDPAASALIKELVDLAANNRKLVRSSKYKAPADPSIVVHSWKMAEHKYYIVPSPFPTLARGIFSTEVGDGEHRIIARGYQKFFNIGEVGYTTWPSIEAHTSGPYTLSLKSNGCIIFIAPLTPTKLLITSKHSIGPATEKGRTSHADAGEKWLRKYLEDKGRTEADLANVLWKNNWTAVAELCDDAFEEHVLAYPPELTGLHLHGINHNTREFKTLPHSEVDAFAAEWGFIKTASIDLPDVAAVRKFADDCSKTGSWNGIPIEGFVVRTQVAPPPPNADARSIPPYPPGSAFFFKIKYDEPYMMYRDWREITKSLLSMRRDGKDDGMNIDKLPKNKLRRAETQAYARWAIKEIRRDPKAFEQYTQNKGIVAIRERFLALDKAKRTVIEADKPIVKGEFGKTIILPIAIPGCGKTVVSLALAHIFGFGHTQSDDIHVKKAAPIFLKNVVELLKKHDVVVADKNNHLEQHRSALRDAIASMDPPVRLMALNWSLDKHAPAMVHRICADRVQGRGENHQTLRPDDAKSHEDVLWMFITQTQALASSEVDEVVEMELGEDLEVAVGRAVDACVRVLGVKPPDAELVRKAIEHARAYVPPVKKPDAAPTKGKKPEAPRYYALLPEVSLDALLQSREALAGVSFWRKLRDAGRVAARPHVTLVHQNALKGTDEEAQAFWEQCKTLHGMKQPPLFRFALGDVVWNDRVMAVTVRDVELVEEGEGEDGLGAKFVATLPDELKQRMHITVGTRDPNVPPVEAKVMVEKWRKNGEGAESVPLGDEVVFGRVKGMVM